MKTLFLMRHGDAPSASSDAQRMLSDKGREQCASMSSHLDKVSLAYVLSSDYQRAIDSAQCLINKLKLSKGPDIETSMCLRPESDVNGAVEVILDKLNHISDGSALLVVFHLPIISEVASVLLHGHRQSSYTFPCASLMALEADLEVEGCLRLLWQHYPEIS